MEKIIATKENRGSVRLWIEESNGNRFLSDNGFVKGARFNVRIELRSGGFDSLMGLVLDANGKHKVSGKGNRSIIDIVRKAEKLPPFVNPKFADTFKLFSWSTLDGYLGIHPN